MDAEETNYILNYFPRLMTRKELLAKKHYLFSAKLGLPKDYDNAKHYELRRQFFLKRDNLTEDPDVLELLDEGYASFALQTASRIKRETPDQYRINRCKECDFIARTPYAKQCRNCAANWHDEIKGAFQFEDTFKLSKRPYFWVMGRLVEGRIKIGSRIDLTNFQINVITEIKQIEYALKSDDQGEREELPVLGIEINAEEEKLIKKYLTKSAKNIMIIGEE